MAELIADDKPLPQFRKDLEIFDGPSEPDGSPTYNLYDPVKAKYFKITWAESLIVKNLKPGMTLDELYKKISEETTLDVTKEDVKFFFIDAFRHDLLAVMKNSEYFEKMREKQEMNFFKWLLFHYLYIRIPIVNPDPFLTKTIKFVRPLGSKIAITLYLTFGIAGILVLFTRFGEFLSTFTYFFNFEGIVVYALAITCVKIIHELSHAYTAKNYGVYVPSMGIALIVLWPVLYTDVTDGWKLKKRKERFFISAAGIIAELIIAGLCTIGWFYSPKGLAQSIFFVIASITWISTLAINLNPAVRFDGYYILGDLWGIDNLQPRSFSLARWKLREWLLGLKTPVPEENVSKERMMGMVIYAIYTWIYRVFLYTGIALFVYYKFTKALGVFLFLLEIIVFLVWPISSEVRALAQMKQFFNANPRIFATVSVLLIALGWFVVPLPHIETFSAITVAEDHQLVYVPSSSLVKDIYVKRGQNLQKGDPIISFVSPLINHQIANYEYQKLILEKEVYLMSFSDKDRAYIPEKKAELASNNEKLSGLKSKKKELDIIAKSDGEVYLWDDAIYKGMSLPKDAILGKIANTEKIEVIAYIPEVDLDVVQVGEKVKFRIISTNDVFYGNVISINPLRTQNLKHDPLASLYYGPLPVTEDPKTGALRMVETYYTIKIEVTKDKEQQLRFGQTGEIELQGPWRSKFMTLVKTILRIFWRESGV